MEKRRRRANDPNLVRTITNALRDADPNLEEGSEAWDAAMFLLAAANVGPSIDRIHKAIGLKRHQVREYASNLRKNGMWKGGRKPKLFHSGWFDEGELGMISFWLDVNIVLGFVNRVGADKYESAK